MNGSGKVRQIEEKKDILSDVLTNMKDCGTLSALFAHPFSVSVGRILIEMRVCFLSTACAGPQVSAYCVCVHVCVWVYAGF